MRSTIHLEVGADTLFDADADAEEVLGTTKAKGSASGPSGYLTESSSILGISSRMRKGLATTSSYTN